MQTGSSLTAVRLNLTRRFSSQVRRGATSVGVINVARRYSRFQAATSLPLHPVKVLPFSGSRTMSTLVNDCIFCKIIRGEIPSFKLYEDESVLIFLDLYPLSEGHSLIIPKYHGARLHDVPNKYLTDVLPLAKRIALAAGREDYNILQNNGATAAQAATHISHVHFHVIPKPNDTAGLIISGNPETVQEGELLKVAERMKDRL